LRDCNRWSVGGDHARAYVSPSRTAGSPTIAVRPDERPSSAVVSVNLMGAPKTNPTNVIDAMRIHVPVPTSAFGGKVDIDRHGDNVAF